MAACELRAGLDVADVGAGTGLFTRLFAPQVAPGKVYAVDIAKKFIEHIEKTCREQNLTNVTGIVCSDDSTGLAADSVDLVFICDTYHHFETAGEESGFDPPSLAAGRTAGDRRVREDPRRHSGVGHEPCPARQAAGDPGSHGCRFPTDRRTPGYHERPIYPAVSEIRGTEVRRRHRPDLSLSCRPRDAAQRLEDDRHSAGQPGIGHVLEHRADRQPRRGRAGPVGLCPLLRAHDVPRHEEIPRPVYDQIVTSLGADSNAYTTDDFTAYHLTFAKEDLERVVDIESDRFQNLSYEKPAFQTEAGAVYGEYRKSITHPFSLLDEKLRDLAYDVHTYKHTTIGFEADIKAMPEAYEYSLSFFRRFYRPENVVLLIVGDVDPPAAMDLVRKYYGAWRRATCRRRSSPSRRRPPNGQATVQYPGKTLPILQISYKGDAFDPDNADYVAALLLGDLAFGETSEIYKKLVLDEQKVQALEAFVPMNRDLPLFDVIAMVKEADDLDMVRDEIYRTLEVFRPVRPTRKTRPNSNATTSTAS